MRPGTGVLLQPADYMLRSMMSVRASQRAHMCTYAGTHTHKDGCSCTECRGLVATCPDVRIRACKRNCNPTKMCPLVCMCACALVQNARTAHTHTHTHTHRLTVEQCMCSAYTLPRSLNLAKFG